MSWKEMIKQTLIGYLTAPIMLIIYAAMVVTLLIFLVAIIRIKKQDRKGLVRPGIKASDLVRAGEIPGAMWPEPIIGPASREQMHPRVKIVFVPDGNRAKPVRFEPGDTQPIEVTRDGETSPERLDRSRDDQDRERARTDLERIRKARTGRSRPRRRAPRSRNRRPDRPEQS
jgi:hypothetical protein